MRYRVRLGSLSALGVTAAMGHFIQSAAAQTPEPGAHGAAPAQKTSLAWVFKPKETAYIAPNKPAWHIADIFAAHKGQAKWAQPVVKDQWFKAPGVHGSPWVV